MATVISLGEVTAENIHEVLETLDNLVSQMQSTDEWVRLNAAQDVVDTYLNLEEATEEDSYDGSADEEALAEQEAFMQELVQTREERDFFYRKYQLVYEDFCRASQESFALQEQVRALEALYARQLVANIDLQQANADLLHDIELSQELS